VSYKQRSKTAG